VSIVVLIEIVMNGVIGSKEDAPSRETEDKPFLRLFRRIPSHPPRRSSPPLGGSPFGIGDPVSC